MGTIRKILVPVDGSDNGCKAVDEAIYLASKCRAAMEFVYVASGVNRDIPSHLIFDRIWQKLPRDILANKHVETGDISSAILKVADATRADMIIMGSRGLGVIKGALMGSVSQKVVEQAKVPVMVVK